MNVIFSSFWSEIKEFATIRRDPLYKVMGRMVWGRHWYLYLLPIFMTGKLATHIRQLVNTYSGFIPGTFNYVVYLLSVLFFLLFVIIAIILFWGYLPFTRNNTKKVFADLQVTSVEKNTIYRVIAVHTFIAFFVLHVFKTLIRMIRLGIFPDSGDLPWWSPLATQTAIVINNPESYQGVSISYSLLSDGLGRLHYLFLLCVLPVLYTLMMTAYWKTSGVVAVIRKSIVIYLVLQIPWIIFMGFRFYHISITRKLDMAYLVDLGTIYSLVLLGMGVLMSWLIWRKVTQIEPFSEAEKEIVSSTDRDTIHAD